MPRAVLRVSISALAAGFVVLGIWSTGVWAQLDKLGPVFLPIGLLILALSAKGNVLLGQADFHCRFPPPWKGAALLFAGLYILPVVLFLALTFHQEFPFVGDHDFQLFAARAGLEFWLGRLPWMIAATVVVAVVCHRAMPAAISPICFIGLVVWSFFAEAPALFSRYPGAFYLLSVPLTALAKISEWTFPLNANRLTNVASIVAWLFLFRPLFVGRWPDWALLPFAAFYFFQKDVVYYFTASYLEPWSIILAITALELLFQNKIEHRWLACLLVGLAALIKEQAILLLPWVWFATLVKWPNLGRHVVLGVVSTVPFLTYYYFRWTSGITRNFRLVSKADFFSLPRLVLFGDRLKLQFGTTGLVLLVATTVLFLALCIVPNSRRRLFQWIAGAVITQQLFFYCDASSVFWTGYPRFGLLSLALIGSVLLYLGSRWEFVGAHSRIALCAALIATLQMPALVQELRLTRLPDAVRNFSEHFDSPVYFPINHLIGKASEAGALSSVKSLVINPSNLRYSMFAVGTAYPRIGKKYVVSLSKESCSCVREDEAILLPWVYRAGVNLLLTDSIPTGALGAYLIKNSDYRTQDVHCRESLERSCRQIFRQTTGDGGLAGVLGVGPR